MIDDTYLTIRKWVPNFIPDDSPPKIFTAWVRIPNLAVEYFDSAFLSKIGSKIGKILRIDQTTAQAVRGQFTRISVEIDLTKPLLAKFWLKGRIWRIQYEGLHMICFKCGCWGHNSSDCPTNVMVAAAMEQPPQGHEMEDDVTRVAPHTTHISPELEADFGEWMMVKKIIRKRQPRANQFLVPGGPVKNSAGGPSKNNAGDAGANPHLNSNLPPSKMQQTFEFQASGSRFASLEARNQDDLVAVKDKAVEQNLISSNSDSAINESINLGDKSQPFSKNPDPQTIIPPADKFNVDLAALQPSRTATISHAKKKPIKKPIKSVEVSAPKNLKPKNAISKPSYQSSPWKRKH